MLLTAKDLQVFEKIKEYINKEGISPSVRDICKIAEVSSSSSAYRYVEKLKRAGLINSKAKLSRSIKIIKEPVQMEADSKTM